MKTVNPAVNNFLQGAAATAGAVGAYALGRSAADKYRKKGKRNADKEEEEEDENKSNNRKSSDDIEKEQSFSVVFVVNNGKAKIKVVETGIQDDRYIEIKSGLSEEDEIIVGPYDQVSRKLTNGQKIEISSKEDFYSGEEEDK